MARVVGCLRRLWVQPAINTAACGRISRQRWSDRRCVHTNVITLAGQEYRTSQGLARSGTEYGPLTDLPDWSYVDGRPAPVSKAAKKRKGKQYTISKRVQELLKEVDLAKIPKEKVEMNKGNKVGEPPAGHKADGNEGEPAHPQGVDSKMVRPVSANPGPAENADVKESGKDAKPEMVSELEPSELDTVNLKSAGDENLVRSSDVDK